LRSRVSGIRCAQHADAAPRARPRDAPRALRPGRW
jgi:hypothetical protein